MSCNMMYKRGIAALLAAVLLLALPLDVRAEEPAAEETEPQAEEVSTEIAGDILLVYPDMVTPEQERNIEFFADGASSLIKKLCFLPASEAVSHLEDFPFCICYDLTGEEDALLDALESYGGHALILGSNFMDALCGGGITPGPDETGTLRYSFDNIDYFEKSVRVRNIRSFTPEEETRQAGSVSFPGKSIPFLSHVDGFAYCPLTDFTDPLPQAAILQEITAWMWPYADTPTRYAQFLVLDEIYPFMPTQDLMELVQLCVDSQIPFVLSVMPIYQNENYPAMQQFCEVLRYAQANGGSIILHAPLEHYVKVEDWEAFYATITKVTRAYTDWGVYPLGLEVPYRWVWDTGYLQFMRRYRTVFVTPTEETAFDLSARTNLLYENYHHLVMPVLELDQTGLSYLNNYSSALYVSSQCEIEELEAIIEAMRSSAVPLKNMWDMQHSVWANNFHLAYQDGILTINDAAQSLVYEPKAPLEDFDYHRNTIKRITVNLQNQNHTLLIAGLAATLIFVGMIFYARYVTIRHFRRKHTLDIKKQKKRQSKE